MKIEMGESLMLSWLRHAKNCQSVQMNWKPSTSSWDLHNEESVEKMMSMASSYYMQKHNLNVFKNNSGYTQFLKQGEIDVLGLEIQNGKVENVYGIDIAFHESGLNYGTKEETVSRVLKKMIRTAMIIHGYFNMDKGQIIFASPKINNATLEPLTEHVNELTDVFKGLDVNFNFKVYTNQNFKEKIFDPVISLSKSVADTSELFMRSIQMYNMFAEDVASTPIVQEQRSIERRRQIQPEGGKDEIKIAVLVRTTITELIQKNLISENMINFLTQKDYSKDTFDINYPLLKAVKGGLSIQEQRKINGYYRYWAHEYTIGKNKYLICQEWFERNRIPFMRWVERLKTG